MNFSWFIRFSGIVHKVSILFGKVIPYGCSTFCFFARVTAGTPQALPGCLQVFCSLLLFAEFPLPDVSGCNEVMVIPAIQKGVRLNAK
jgi:hypothetical protein